MTAVHVPVLLREVLSHLDLRPGLIVVDGTVGAGGHSREILPRIRPGGRLIGLDRDPLMLGYARAAVAGPDVHLQQASYRDLRSVLDVLHLPAADRVLIDLGLSSDQLADRTRGFGFEAGGKLDMRFDPTSGISAAEWLNTVPEAELVHALSAWGEVPQAERLASALVRHRRRRPFETTDDLLAVVRSEFGVRGPHGSIKDPAPQVFQALRIAVNQELEHLRTFLDDVLPRCLVPGGRVAIISFHSVEDRMVKQALRPEHGWTPTPKRPISPTPSEVRVNPRSRSARLRVALRTPAADRS